MVVVLAKTAGCDPVTWATEKKRLASHFSAAEGVTSLSVQIYDGVSTPDVDDPVECLSGTDHIVEKLFGLEVRVCIPRWLIDSADCFGSRPQFLLVSCTLVQKRVCVRACLRVCVCWISV